MTQIILSGEQASALAAACEPIYLVDANGHILGIVNPLHGDDSLTVERIAELESRIGSDGPWYSLSEVQEHLQRLTQ
jgi:hypothetical protein